MSVYVAAVLFGLVSRLESDREVACLQFYLPSTEMFLFVRNLAMVVNCTVYTLVVYLC